MTEPKVGEISDSAGDDVDAVPPPDPMLAVEDLAASLGKTSIDPSATPSSRATADTARNSGSRAGRRQIGLSVPSGSAAAQASLLPRPSPAAYLQKALLAVDTRLLSVVCAPIACDEGAARERAEVMCETALLLQLRRTAQRLLDDPPKDVVLVEDLVGFAEEVACTVSDLEQAGRRRITRLLDFVAREIAEFAALGGDAKPFRATLRSNRKRLESQGDAAASPAAVVAFELFAEIREQLDGICPPSGPPCLLDDILAAQLSVS